MISNFIRIDHQLFIAGTDKNELHSEPEERVCPPVHRRTAPGGKFGMERPCSAYKLLAPSGYVRNVAVSIFTITANVSRKALKHL